MADEISKTEKLDLLLPSERMRDSKDKKPFQERSTKRYTRKVDIDSEDIIQDDQKEEENNEGGSRSGKIIDIIV